MSLTDKTAERVFKALLESAPTLVVHPDDATEVRQLVAAVPREIMIEETELAEPGQVTIFIGRRMPITDLGRI